MKPTTSTRWLLRKLNRTIEAIEIVGTQPAHLDRIRIVLRDADAALLDVAGNDDSSAGELLAQSTRRRGLAGMLVFMADIDATSKRGFASELQIDLWLAADPPPSRNARSTLVFDLARREA